MSENRTQQAALIESMAAERRALAERLRFFDANLWLGPPSGFPLAEGLGLEALGGALRDRCLTGGLISHWRGKVVSAQDGNQALLDAADGPDADLFTVWTGLPLFPGEADDLIPGYGEVPPRARGVRIFPRSHNFPLTDWCVGSLCEWLVGRRMPLFIWHVESDWPALYQLAQAFPALRIIVETQTQKILYHTRPLFALMRDCANVYVETSNFAGAGFIEHAVRELGAERLVFGSFLPVSDPFVPMGMVLDADIPERDKSLIAGGNLRRLVDEVQL